MFSDTMTVESFIINKNLIFDHFHGSNAKGLTIDISAIDSDLHASIVS